MERKKILSLLILICLTLLVYPISSYSSQEQLAESAPNNLYLGIKEFKKDNFSAARKYLEAARSDFVGLRDYVLYYLGRCLEESGETQQAIFTFQRLLAQYPQSRFVPETTLKLADILFFLEKYKSARKYYQQSLTKLPDQKDYIYFQMALSLMEEKAWPEARHVLKKIFIQFPDTEYAKLSKLYIEEVEIESHLPPLIFSEAERIQIIQNLMKDGHYKKALAKILQLPKGARRTKPSLLYKKAYCHSKLGKKDQALKVLNGIIKSYPYSSIAVDSLLLKGSILWNLDRDDEAIKAYRQVVQKFRWKSGAARARYLMGRIYEQNQKHEKAIQCFKKLVQDYPKSKYYAESLWRIGWSYYQQEKFKKARKHFKNSLTKVQEASDKHQLLYWQARAAEKSHDRPGALKLYRTIVNDPYFSYYSWWALRRVDEGPPPLVGSFSAQGKITRVSYSDKVHFHLSRAQKLLKYRLKEEAAGEIRTLSDTHQPDPGYWYNLGKMAKKAGLPRQVVLAGYRCQQLLAHRGQSSESYADVLQLLYPLCYWEYIQKYAGQHELDPLMVCALMRQESLFDPLSLSSAQAYGLMQIIPSTAKMIARRIDIFGGKDFKVEKLYQPEVNIAFGCWYLADLMQKFNGNLAYTLISYNAGENALQRWCKQYTSSSIDEFVEMISYKETRNYVKKVIRNYGYYLRLYGKPQLLAPKQAGKQADQARRRIKKDVKG